MFILTTLLGLGFMLGFLPMTSEVRIQEYAFVIINASSGKFFLSWSLVKSNDSVGTKFYYVNQGNYIEILYKKGCQKSLGKNGIIQNSMLHLELGIQTKQGWQFLYYCHKAIEKLFFHLSLFPTCLTCILTW